ncbi:MAG: molecular chaperone TorD family protein [Desulfuromonadaceae bacterium]|nr:molecular chaperone TorD family protein [Desulfuromonadaceae bacterium]
MNNSKPKTPAAFYTFLAQSFRYPERTWLIGPYFDLLENISQNLDLNKDALGLRQSYCASEEGLEELQIEYTRMFINAIPAVVAPPYSSIYLDKEGNLYGRSAVWAKQFYQLHGFDLAGEEDLPDHLVLELDFLGLLLEEGQEDAAEQFLSEHFRRWFPSFKERVLNGSTNKFYSTLLTLVDFFTREEP